MMSLIIRRTCYGITALGLLLAAVGLATDPGLAVAGFYVAMLFGFFSALLQVRRLFSHQSLSWRRRSLRAVAAFSLCR